MQKNPTAGAGGLKGGPKKGAKVTKKVRRLSLILDSGAERIED